jgi:hypothetical protein
MCDFLTVTDLRIDGFRKTLRLAADRRVIEHGRSIVFDQAENRVHSFRGLLLPPAG